MKSQNKKIAIALAVLAVLAVIFGAVYFFNRPQGTAGEKTIEVAVIFGDGTAGNHTIKTSEEFLRGALEQEKLISVEESQYGLFVKTVDGVTADDSKQEWWFFSKDGQMLETSVDSTPIADGDHFEITLTSGY